MADFDFDLFTIGAGSGGVAASRRAGALGARVAICEATRVGGTCVLRGCVPKKLLVLGTQVRDELDDARGFGWTIDGARLDWGALIAAKDRELDRLNAVYVRLLRDAGVTLIEGRGKLVDPHTVEVDGERFTARHVLVSTGSHPWRPDTTGAEHGISSDEALSLPEVPRRILIVGGGYVGCELAGVLHAAGAHVTMLVRGDTLLRGFDDDVRATLTHEYRRRGIEVRSELVIQDVERRDDGTLSILTKSEELLETDALLFATGRAPNTHDLGLEALGVRLCEDDSIDVDERSRTTVPSVFAVGDCTNRIKLTPVAIAQGRALVEMLFAGGDGVVDHSMVPTAVFSNPPVATVGCSERVGRKRHGEIDVYLSTFRPMKHTLSGRPGRTLMKLVVERATQRVVGLHVVGPDAPEIVQGFAVAIRCGATKQDFDGTIGIHPTAAEELVTMRDKRPEPTVLEEEI